MDLSWMDGGMYALSSVAELDLMGLEEKIRCMPDSDDAEIASAILGQV